MITFVGGCIDIMYVHCSSRECGAIVQEGAIGMNVLEVGGACRFQCRACSEAQRRLMNYLQYIFPKEDDETQGSCDPDLEDAGDMPYFIDLSRQNRSLADALVKVAKMAEDSGRAGGGSGSGRAGSARSCAGGASESALYLGCISAASRLYLG